MVKKLNLEEKLTKVQLEYYSLLLKNLKEQEEISEAEIQETQKQDEEQGKMWERFHKLNDKKIVKDVFKVIKNNVETSAELSAIRNPFNFIYVKEYFLNKGIDIDVVFRGGLFDYSDTIRDNGYFELYGMKELIRWKKIRLEIEKLTKELNQELIKKELQEKIQKFVDLAIDEELYDVTNAHIKRLAMELDEDVSNQINMLTNAVSVKLRKHWGDNHPKRKRELTKSIKIEVLKRDGYKCVECGKGKDSVLEIHHIVPHSKGGTDEMSNLLTLCKSCNMSIGNRIYKPPKDWVGYATEPKWKKGSLKKFV